MRRPRLVHAALALAALGVVVLAAGCGGGGAKSDEAATPTTSPTTTAKARQVTVVKASMSGQASIPKGPPGATGTARITLNPNTATACWQLTVRGVDVPVSAHIHQGKPGEVGEVIIPLGDRFSRKGCVLSNARAVGAVAKSPDSYYVDVHTKKNINGAMRGQLRVTAT
jgi:hypothetical protein